MATTIPTKVYQKLAELVETEARYREEEQFSQEYEIDNYLFDMNVEVNGYYDEDEEKFYYFDIENIEVTASHSEETEDDFIETMLDFDYKLFSDILDGKDVEEVEVTTEEHYNTMLNNVFDILMGSPMQELESILPKAI